MNQTFYGRFYGFESPPFHITPDPALIFPTETHQQALGAIEYAIASGKGFVVITGEVGVGKTTVLRMCLDKLDSKKIKTIYIFNPAVNIQELYATILEELDAPPTKFREPAGILRMLLRALLIIHKAGIQVILAVDEAQNMPPETLEGLRILSNLETAKSKLLQIILVGQPELDSTLAKHSLRQLAQRVAVRAFLKPLTIRESRRYILHRLECAGRRQPLFTAPALLYLAITSRGIARKINISCDNALINGYGYAAQRISLRIVRESSRSLRFRSPIRRVGLLSAMAAVALLIFFYSWLKSPSEYSSEYHRPNNARELSKTLESKEVLITAGKSKERRDQTEAQFGTAVAFPSGQADATPTNLVETVNASGQLKSETSRSMPSEEVRKQPVLSEMPSGEEKHNEHSSDSTTSVSQMKAPPAWKWLVRKGDSVYKVCLLTYGECNRQALRLLLAYNPQIRANGMIQEGMILVMPEHIDPRRSN
jgi:general secretion pathway protein A